MGVTLTDVLLFGKAQSDDVDNATLVIYRRNILRWSTIGGYLDIIVKGVAPLSLPDAIANSLSYVKAFGGTEQNGTPTPDAPMDIVSNNGVLKAVHQSGLPLGYKLVDYIKANARIELDTLTNNTMEFVAKFYREGTNAQYLYQSDTTSGGTTNTTSYISSGGNWRFGSRTAAIDVGTGVMITSVQNASGVWLNGEQVGTYEGVTAFTSTNNLRLFGTTQATPQLRLYGLKVYQNGALFYDLLPCQRESDSAYGVYDLVSGQFFTNTDATITTGSFVSDPVEIYTDGTVETINVHGKNLFDDNSPVYKCSAIGNNTAVSSFTSVSSTSNAQTYGMAVKPNTTYTISKVDGNRLAIGGFKSVTIPGDSQITAEYSYNGVRDTFTGSKTFTTDSDCVWILVCVKNNTTIYDEATNIQLELGSTATTYEPYYDGGTATAEMLLKVDDYQDVQSIIDGTVNRQLGVFILDGTESWAYSAGYSDTETNACFYIPTGSSTIPILPQTGTTVECLCSHFRWVSRNDIYNNKTPIVGAITGANGEQRIGISITLRVPLSIANTSATDFKQWLADQYAAGTPVIVIYPLATPTTESVTGQTLQVTEGDNTLEITQAGLNNLELEAKYQAAVSLTIQEVQDANLDNNVEVTIS